ncbi:MAG: hypothetical protein FWD94_01275 [Treponema sp.]|nr:hypothetical protein [Treponema sp.]
MVQVSLPGKVYQCVPGFESHLQAELRRAGVGFSAMGRLLYVPEPGPEPVFWHLNSWLRPFRLEFGSIGDAATALRGIQRNWAAVLDGCFRRGTLIASKLPPIGGKPRPFPWLPGTSPMGAWTLLDEHTLVASPACSSPFPAGVVEFVQDREGPPSRAYLKLWEALVRLGQWPKAGESCLDAGSSPGGWTWALAGLGAKVLSVDRSPLDPAIAGLPEVTFARRDAFSLLPEEVGRLDWLFCDVACYPPKLYRWILKWLESGLCRRFVCTVKMQGSGPESLDFETPKLLAGIPGSSLVHLWHNKHELTWMYPAD